MYENIITIELLRRGYELYIGTLYNKEIDFVTIKQHEKFYFQVLDNIQDEKTFQREVKPLLNIKDTYPKVLLANTNHDNYTYEGAQVINIANWLLDI